MFFLPIFLLTILYTINISFLLIKELPLVWKNVTLIFNILAFLCSIPTAYLLYFVVSLDVTFNSGSEETAKLISIGIVFYFFLVNVILTLLLARKNAVGTKKSDDPQEIAAVKGNIKLKCFSIAFLLAAIGIVIYRSVYGEEREIFFTKGHSGVDFFLFYIFTFIISVVVMAFIISLKKKEVLKFTAISLALLFAVVLLLNFFVKPNDYAALSRTEKEHFLELSLDYLEEVYPEGIESSKVSYEKSSLGGRYIRVSFNYIIKDCEQSCGPYHFDSDYHIKNAALVDVIDSGQRPAGNDITIVSKNNKDVSFAIEQKESIIQTEEKKVFIKKGNEADIKEQVVNLIEEGYDYSSNNGLPTRPNHHFDRLKFTKHKKADYKKLLAVDPNIFYDVVKTESEHSHSGETEFELFPLGTTFDKIVIEVNDEGYVVKGLPFKLVDSRARFNFDLGNGETFTGVLESDRHFRMDRVWVTIENEGTSVYEKGEIVQIKY